MFIGSKKKRRKKRDDNFDDKEIHGKKKNIRLEIQLRREKMK